MDIDSDDKAVACVFIVGILALLAAYGIREASECCHRRLELEAIRAGVELPPRDTEETD